ncbi:MAG: response regulator [Planctomycetota bacterium]
MARILTIDDSPLARSVVRIVLERDGHTLIEASDGIEGLDTAINERPDIILCGVTLPGMGAHDVARCLRSAGIASPMIALGHDTDRGSCIVSADLGIIGMVGRPICADALRSGVDAAIHAGSRFAA